MQLEPVEENQPQTKRPDGIIAVRACDIPVRTRVRPLKKSVYPGIPLELLVSQKPLLTEQQAWTAIVREAKQINHPFYAQYLRHTRAMAAEGGTLWVTYPSHSPIPSKFHAVLSQAVSNTGLDVREIEWFSYEDFIDPGERFGYHPLSKAKAEEIHWLVKGYLPKGMLIYFFAPKGRGKTKICDWFAAGVTNKGRRVIRFNLEDDERAILKPCLYAAGANLDFVVIPEGINGEHPDFSKPEHLQALKRLIFETGASLVIIEPVNNYKGSSKSNSEDDMRPIFMGLAEVARETNAAILAVGHTNKKQDVDVLDKAMGDGSHTRVARVNLFLEKNPHDSNERILTNAGSNIYVGEAMVFEIVEQAPFQLDGTEQRNVAIALKQGTRNISGDELLDETRITRPISESKSRDIEMFLRKFLDGKSKVETDLVRTAIERTHPEWPWDLVKKVFRRKKLGESDTEGGNKSKKTYWIMRGES